MCVCVCVFAVCLLVQRGKGGQVFALTRFNEGSVCFCVRACVRAPLCVKCLFAFVRVCFRREYTSKRYGRVDGSCWFFFFYYVLLSGSFIHYLPCECVCVRVKSELRGVFKLPIRQERTFFEWNI